MYSHGKEKGVSSRGLPLWKGPSWEGVVPTDFLETTSTVEPFVSSTMIYSTQFYFNNISHKGKDKYNSPPYSRNRSPPG
jgi:hypothetical protein